MARLDGPGSVNFGSNRAPGQNKNTNFAPPSLGGVIDKGKDIAQDIFDGVGAGASNFVGALRSANLPGKGDAGIQAEEAVFTNKRVEDKDWRVSLTMPDNPPEFKQSPILAPLKSTGNRLVFPYTPSIIMQHRANYNQMAPVHNNYPFYTYENSSVEALTITGRFYVQNALDAQYWVAIVHYLRSITKMDYGQFATGQPPPIVKLNGYGDYVFNNVPVVIGNWSTDLPNEVDYVATELTTKNKEVSWAPAESQIMIEVIPIYSKDTVRKFNYRSFIKGDNIGKGYI